MSFNDSDPLPVPEGQNLEVVRVMPCGVGMIVRVRVDEVANVACSTMMRMGVRIRIRRMVTCKWDKFILFLFDGTCGFSM
jgi:hypothetical protein